MSVKKEKLIDMVFNYHHELAQKCLSGERQALSRSDRELAIKVEIYELINECQDWKPWKKGKPNNIEKIKEEIADVLLFTFDLFNEVPIHENKKNINAILSLLPNALENAQGKSLSSEWLVTYAEEITEIIPLIMSHYEIPIEQIYDAIELKIAKNKCRTDHV